MIEAIDNIGIEWLLGSDSSILDHIALTMTNAWTWVPLYVALLILIIKNNDNMRASQNQGLLWICDTLCCIGIIDGECGGETNGGTPPSMQYAGSYVRQPDSR